MTKLNEIDLVRAASTVFELNAQPGDKVLIIADTQTDPSVWKSLATAARMADYDPVISIFSPRRAHNNEPPETVIPAMEEADLALFVTSRAMAHTDAKKRAVKAGTRYILMEEITPEILLNAGTADQYRALQATAQALHKAWTEGDKLHIKDDNGTDFTANISGRRGFYLAGIVTQDKEMGRNGCAFPDGECGIAPMEGTGEGVIVFDTSMHHIGWLNEPITLHVERGRIASIEGGVEAAKLRKIIEEHGDENALNCPAEVSVGLNPNFSFSGVARTDKKVYGGMHVAHGSSFDIGGTVKSNIHLDGVIGAPTLTIDGREVLRGGQILL